MESVAKISNDPYVPVIATITLIEQLTQSEKRFWIRLPHNRSLKHQPGQFVEVSVFGFGEAPISISSSPTRSPGFELTVRKTGRLTEKLHSLSVGSQIGIRGPFGHGFDVHLFKGKDLLFIAGGIGLAPLKSLIEYALDKRHEFNRLIILYGARNPAEILYPLEIKEWGYRDDVELHLTVDRPDDQWKGNVGVITTLIPPLKLDLENTIATIVGPPVMYKYVLMALKAKRLPDANIYMSLERRMKCGLGKCGHCQINDSYVCQEGPVYSYLRIKELKEAI